MKLKNEINKDELTRVKKKSLSCCNPIYSTFLREKLRIKTTDQTYEHKYNQMENSNKSNSKRYMQATPLNKPADACKNVDVKPK